MRRAIAIAILSWVPVGACLADVYRSVDSQGHVQYSDTPTPGAELVRMTGVRAGSSLNAPAPPPPTTVAKSTDPVHDKLVQDAAARAVQKDTSESRADQCKKAQDAYQASIQARRIYKAGADGGREYLSDADADQVRLTNRTTMEALCGPQ